jgi:hypothetical protein
MKGARWPSRACSSCGDRDGESLRRRLNCGRCRRPQREARDLEASPHEPTGNRTNDHELGVCEPLVVQCDGLTLEAVGRGRRKVQHDPRIPDVEVRLTLKAAVKRDGVSSAGTLSEPATASAAREFRR